MSTLALYSKIELLPEHLKKQVLDYIEFLLSREVKGQQAQASKDQKSNPKIGSSEVVSLPDGNDKLRHMPLVAKKPLKAGFLKGSFVMSDDFDEPIEDFKDYME